MVGTVKWRVYGPARVEIDLNDRAQGGLTRAWLRDLPGNVKVGDEVTAYEPEDGVCARAEVAEIDRAKGLAFLRVDWGSLREDEMLIETSMTNATVVAAHPDQRVSSQNGVVMV